MSKSPRKRDEVDGIYQGDRVRNTRTGKSGEVTFADPHPYPTGREVHVRTGGDAEIWPHTEVRRTG